MTDLPVLPCYPCPHQSICCSWGTTLSDEEAEAIGKARGPETRYLTRWGEWRTRVRGGRCIFLGNNVCTIHGESFYPAVCRGFPWTDAETGGHYEYDQTICPEFVHRPELTLIGKPASNRTSRRGTLPALAPQNAGECDPGRGESKPL